MDVIRHIEVERRSLPLRRPYLLSFGALAQFDVLFCRILDTQGRLAVGEVVPVPAYGGEGIDEAFELANRWALDAVGIGGETFRHFLEDQWKQYPATASLFLSAMDLCQYRVMAIRSEKTPLVGAVATRDEYLERNALRLVEAGFRTLKIKLGGDVEVDWRSMELLRHMIPDDIVLRCDANQAYSRHQAHEFLGRLSEPFAGRIELLEQPLHRADWEGVKELAGRWPGIPLMLDESIWNIADVAMAAKMGASYIKLKYLKAAGAGHLIAAAKAANEHGLKVVLGNGIASGVINLLELLIYNSQPSLFWGASESNGFDKIDGGPESDVLTAAEGAAHIRLQAGRPFRMDR